MKKSRFGCMIAAGVMATAVAVAPGTAAAQESYRIGFVNTERVMRESRVSQQAQKQLEAEFNKRDQEIAGAEARLKRLAEELERRGGNNPSAADRQKRENEAGELKRDIARRRTAFSEDFDLRRADALKQILDRANAAVKRIAEQEKLDLVFIDAVYTNPRIDLTDKVIKALDAAR